MTTATPDRKGQTAIQVYTVRKVEFKPHDDITVGEVSRVAAWMKTWTVPNNFNPIAVVRSVGIDKIAVEHLLARMHTMLLSAGVFRASTSQHDINRCFLVAIDISHGYDGEPQRHFDTIDGYMDTLYKKVAND